MAKTSYIYCDSNVFLAYFNEEDARVELLDTLFEEIKKDPMRRILTSSITIVEVAEAVSGYQDQINVKRLDSFWADRNLLEFADFHERIAHQARDLTWLAAESGLSLKSSDAVHLASALMFGAREFLTYDNLIQFTDLTGLDIKEPYVNQPRLL